MKKYLRNIVGMLAILCVSFPAYSLTTYIKGTLYYQVAKTSYCPGGKPVLKYARKYWCKYYPHTLVVSWRIPSTHTDGTPLLLSELSGYEVYYTTGSTDTVVKVSGGTTTTVTIPNFYTGTYCVAVSAVDVYGQKSPLSTVTTVYVP